MKSFRYSGPLSVTTLYKRTPEGKREPLRVTLRDGEEQELPEEHPLVRALIARGRLTPVEPDTLVEPETNSGAAPEPDPPKHRVRGRRPEEPRALPSGDVDGAAPEETQ